MKLDNELRTLAYAIHMSYVDFAQPLRRKNAESVIHIGHPFIKEFREMAFAWARALPNRTIEFQAASNPDPANAKVLWRVGQSAPGQARPELRFWAWPADVLGAWIEKAERYWRDAPGAVDLDGMTAYQQCAAKADKFVAATKEADLAAREAARASAHVFPPLKGSDEDKALITARVGQDFYVNYEVGKVYFATRGKSTTAKPMIAKLRDPDFKLVEFRESASEYAPEGWVEVLAMFAWHSTPTHVSHEYSYYAPPSLSLIEARDIGDVSKRPRLARKKSLKDRKDII